MYFLKACLALSSLLYSVNASVILLQANDTDSGEGGEDGSGGDLLDPFPISGHRPRWGMKTTLFLIGCIILSLGYLIYSPPKAIQQFIQKHLKSRRFNFRVSEGRLVGWANEDDIVLEDEEESVYDVMVNADSGPGQKYDLDEGIPLTPSPKRGGFLAKYGSA